MATWTIQVRSSRSLTGILVAAHALAGIAVVATPLAPPSAVALVVLILASAIAQLRGVARLTAQRSIVALEIDEWGCTTVTYRDGRRHAATVLASSFVTRHLTLVRVRFDRDRRVRSVVLVPDNCDPTSFRRLRVALTWQIGPALSAAGGRPRQLLH